MKRSAAKIVREYGPFPGADSVGGVTFDGQNVWFAAGDTLKAFDPASGKTLRSIDVAAHAGTAFDGEHLFQIAEDRIQKIDPKTGRVLATIPAPGGGGDSGLTWAEGTLWVGQYRDRKIHQVDPQTGAILRTIESNRFVTGVTWIDGELWHGTWEGDESDLRRVDPRTGEVLERLEMPPGVGVSGLETDGGDQFFCGGGKSGKVRAVRRPKRGSATVKSLPIASFGCLVLLANLMASSAHAQSTKAPQAYSVTEVTSMFGPSMTLKVDRDGDRAVVDETVPAHSAGSTGIHTRSYYNLKNRRSFSVDLDFATANCSTGTIDDNWFDPYEISATLMGDFANARQVGTETVNGFATKVLESGVAGPGYKKVWLDTASGLIVKAQAGAEMIFEVKRVSLAKPPASLFAVPAACIAAPPPAS
jgi:glutamine cyclotransferase